MIDRRISLGGALLIVLKWTLIVLGALIAVGLLIGAAYWMHQHFTHDVHVARVVPVVKATSNDCPEAYPLFVGFRNESTRTVLKISFSLEARVPGYSTNIAHWETYSHDRITKPNTGWGLCYNPALERGQPTRNLRSLEWGVKVWSVAFE